MDHATFRSPSEVLAAVPYMFGFQPTNSLVLLVFHGKRFLFQARIDLPPVDQAADAAEYLAGVTARNLPSGDAAERDGPVAVVLAGYGGEAEVVPLANAVLGELGRRGVPVAAILRVDAGRYWNMLCSDPSCCPPDGSPFDPDATEYAAAATFCGLVVHPDRAALAATLEPVAGPGIEPEVTRALERLGLLAGGQRGLKAAARAAVRQAFERYMNGGRLDDDEVAWLAVLLADVLIRDDTWARVVSGPTVPEHEEIWRDVVRRAPLRYVPGPATLLALVAWRAGDGVLADLAAERALAADPSYRLGRLLLQALRSGLPPSTLDDMSPVPRRRRRRAPRLSEAA
jgi:hypothetical protein